MPMDLSFYYAAIPAVILVGLAKGGMGDALSLIGLPFLALVVSPVQAAAILLPLLVSTMVRGGVEPTINAISTIVLVVTTVAIFVAYRLREEKMA